MEEEEEREKEEEKEEEKKKRNRDPRLEPKEGEAIKETRNKRGPHLNVR